MVCATFKKIYVLFVSQIVRVKRDPFFIILKIEIKHYTQHLSSAPWLVPSRVQWLVMITFIITTPDLRLAFC